MTGLFQAAGDSLLWNSHHVRGMDVEHSHDLPDLN